MASADVQQAPGHSTSFDPIAVNVQQPAVQKHHVRTALNYYKDPGDGSEPLPAIVGKPETYERPAQALEVTVQDIRGEEDKYTLDGNGFQLYAHTSAEKEFRDDAKIKAEYYPETEQLLKDA